MTEPEKPNGRRIPEDVKEKVHELLSDWRIWLTETFDQVERFTREKPATGLALSFLTGFVISSWFRRKK